MASTPQPVRPPLLELPTSTNTVQVSVIDTTSTVYPPTSLVFKNAVGSHRVLECPCYSFLIRHQGSSGEQQLLFDLGIRKDYQKLAPAVREFTADIKIDVEKDVVDILGDEKIDAVIWSHHHFDHIGDLSRFPPETELIVGPGFKKEFLPGYPARPESWILESDYSGRPIREIEFESGDEKLEIGGFAALDFFGDGSFYILDCPGHSIGHIIALARTTSTGFVLLGADCCHHGGELRPNECPGVTHDIEKAEESIKKLAPFDANEDILFVWGHDMALKGVLHFWPDWLNDWKKMGWKERLTWAFLDDFGLEVPQMVTEATPLERTSIDAPASRALSTSGAITEPA